MDCFQENFMLHSKFENKCILVHIYGSYLTHIGTWQGHVFPHKIKWLRKVRQESQELLPSPFQIDT